MTISDLLFFLDGRVSLSTFWLKFILTMWGIFIITVLMDSALPHQKSGQTGGHLSVLVSLLSIYPSIAISVKRCHDRGYSGWFLLVGVIPLLNIWLWVELYFLGGIPGRNRYGNAPLS